MKIKTTFTIAAILLAAAQFACAATVTLTPLNVFLNKPVGLGYNSVSSSLIISINYDNGLPNQFAQLPASGVPSQFSNASGWSHGEEITHTIIPTALVGFQTGDVYAPNGEPGGIGRIRADGTEERFWTTLVDGQNTESGSVSGLYLDTAGVFTDDYRLIAVTTAGGIWRVKSDGTAKLLKQTSFTTLEGVVTVPNNSRYGPWTNQVLVGAENASEILAVTAGGVVTPYSLTANGQTVTPEDILIVPANQNFFITDFGSNRLLTAPASQFTSLAGEIIVTQEGLDGVAKLVHVTGFSGQSAQGELLYSGANAFEHATFAPITVSPPPQNTVVTVAATSPLTGEGAAPGVFTLKRTTPGGPLTVNIQVTKNPTSGGVNYTLAPPSTTSFTFADGQTEGAITLTPTDDSVQEQNTIVTLTVLSGSGYVVGTPSSDTIDVADNDGSAPNVVIVIASDPVASEKPANLNQDTGMLKFLRAGNVSGPLAVTYANDPSSTATPPGQSGADYTLTDGFFDPPFRATFGQPNVIEEDVTLAPIFDNVSEPTETAKLNLVAGSGYVVGSHNSATVQIFERPVASITALPPGTAYEFGGAAYFQVSRTGSTADDLSVNLFVPFVTGDAIKGRDYRLEPDITTTAGSSTAVTVPAGLSSILITLYPLNSWLDQASAAFVQVMPPDTDNDTSNDAYTVGAGATGYAEVVIDPGYGPNSFNIVDLGNDYGASQAFAVYSGVFSITGYGATSDCPGSVLPVIWGTSGNATYPYGGCSYPYGFYPQALNYSRSLAGYYNYYGSGSYPFAYNPVWGWTWLGELGPAGTSIASGINDNGDVVGYSQNNSGVHRAVIWSSGSTTPTDLGSLDPNGNVGVPSEAYVIIGNLVVGKSKTSTTGSYHGFKSDILAGIRPQDDLGTLTTNPSHTSQAYALNSIAAAVVGSSTALSGDDHAFIIPFGSQLGPVWDLGTLGAYSSTAYSLNQYGQVVGTSLRYFGEDPQSRAFICRHGIAMQDLNDLVYNLGDWRLRSATGISDEGYICGWGYKGASSTPRAFVLSPY